MNVIIEKLHSQTVVRVNKELEVEAERRIKSYMASSIAVLVREGILTRDEANRDAAKFGISSSDIYYTSNDSDYGSSCPPSQPKNNRC